MRKIHYSIPAYAGGVLFLLGSVTIILGGVTLHSVLDDPDTDKAVIDAIYEGTETADTLRIFASEVIIAGAVAMAMSSALIACVTRMPASRSLFAILIAFGLAMILFDFALAMLASDKENYAGSLPALIPGMLVIVSSFIVLRVGKATDSSTDSSSMPVGGGQ